MSTAEVFRGTLKSDGTVQLETVPNLPAGPVEVVLRSLPGAEPNEEDWWQYLQRVRAEAERTAGPFRSRDEIEKQREDFRRGDERIEGIRRATSSDEDLAR